MNRRIVRQSAGRGRRLAAAALKRLFRRKDPFDRFQDTVLPSTWEGHDSVLDWALGEVNRGAPQSGSDDRLVSRGLELKSEVEAGFRGKHVRLGRWLRVMIQLPDFSASPGGYSLFSNLISSLNFVGVAAEPLTWKESSSEAIRRFRPTCFLTSDHESYLGRVDWTAIHAWKAETGMLLGLTASLEEEGNTPLGRRLSWAERNEVDFYYAFGSPEYLQARSEYDPFRGKGRPLFSIEFGANPLIYHPVERPTQDLDYVFLASSNPDKHERYLRYLPPIMNRYRGFVDGPGWKRTTRWAPPPAHRFLYARARVGLNLHIAASIKWPSELNERTYILAACGTPQLVDSARLLQRRFGPGCFFTAESPQEYYEMFQSMLADPDESRRRALRALEEVFARHTTFHRVDVFLADLCRSFGAVAEHV